MQIGDRVLVNADNHGGLAEIIGYRDGEGKSPASHWKVRDDTGQEFWVFDFEIAPLPDSRPDTEAHIARVQQLLSIVTFRLTERAGRHDASKLEEPERSGYDLLRLLIEGKTYGTPEYAAVMNDPRIKGAIGHHVTTNSHHPQAHADGVNDMTLLDLVEMFCDWKAASERGSGKALADSLSYSCQRWGISEQLTRIFENTRKELEW